MQLRGHVPSFQSIHSDLDIVESLDKEFFFYFTLLTWIEPIRNFTIIGSEVSYFIWLKMDYMTRNSRIV